jgi:CelD/BcsL family acetyltransferase involved in cellulose biosynthesis
MLQLGRVPRGSVVQALAGPAASHRVAVDTVPSITSPMVRIQGGWDAYQATLTNRFRQNLRNRVKRLKAMGTVTFEIVDEPAAALVALGQGLALEASGWKAENGTAILLDPTLESYYRRVAAVAAAHGWLRLFFLKVDERPVAFAMRLLYENRVYCIKIGNDPEFKPYSVGQLLCQEMLRWAHEQGVREYDFMGERNRQKLDWARDVREHVTLYAHNSRLLSRLHRLQRFTARRILKRVLPERSVAALRALRA